MKKFLAALLALGLLAATTAFAAEGSEGLIGFQITNGTADLYDSGFGTDDYITAYQAPEIGFAFQYWRLMRKDYAFTMSIGMGTASEKDQSNQAGEPDHKYTQSSWSVRVGGDRAAKVGDRAIIYFGPGLEYWTGKAKFEGWNTNAYESENVTRIGASGRIGGVMMLSDKVGFNCQVGRYVGLASAEERGAKANWYASGFQASGGFIFKI